MSANFAHLLTLAITLTFSFIVQDFGDEDEAEDYSLTPRLLSNLFSLDGPGSNSPGMPLSPSLVSLDLSLVTQNRVWHSFAFFFILTVHYCRGLFVRVPL